MCRQSNYKAALPMVVQRKEEVEAAWFPRWRLESWMDMQEDWRRLGCREGELSHKGY